MGQEGTRTAGCLTTVEPRGAQRDAYAIPSYLAYPSGVQILASQNPDGKGPYGDRMRG